MAASRVFSTSGTIITVFALSIAVVGCGGGSTNKPTESAPASNTNEAPANPEISSDPAVRDFFARLGASGEDLQSDFGGALVTLGMNPRDLEQDDPKHAYDTVMEKVRKVEDAELRREMLRTFFNLSETP